MLICAAPGHRIRKPAQGPPPRHQGPRGGEATAAARVPGVARDGVRQTPQRRLGQRYADRRCGCRYLPVQEEFRQRRDHRFQCRVSAGTRQGGRGESVQTPRIEGHIQPDHITHLVTIWQCAIQAVPLHRTKVVPFVQLSYNSLPESACSIKISLYIHYETGWGVFPS